MTTDSAAFYKITQLKSDLIFIQWHRTPLVNSPINHKWVDDLQKLVEEATEPQYFFSDVRRGQVRDMTAIRRLGRVVKHPNYGGGVAFGTNIASSTYVQITINYANSDDHIYRDLAEAITGLDKFKPGVTKGIDWEALLNS